MIRTGNIDHQHLEEGHELLLDFHKLRKVAQSPEPVLPVAVQHADTKEVMIQRKTHHADRPAQHA